MKAVLLPGEMRVEVVERPDPSPGPGEVVVRMRASCICRSDMSLYHGNPIVGGDAAGTGTVVPGHEAAGDIVAVGAGVTRIAEGDRVAVHLAVGCGRCEHCRQGLALLCLEWKCVGFDVDGGDAEYVVVPAANCLPLPDSLSYVAGAVLTDMVGTQYNAQKRLGVSGGDTVAVFGLGPMGLAGVMVAHALGARVIGVEPIADRRALAVDVGADETLDSGEDPVGALLDLTGGRGVDAAIDCSGAPEAQNAALDAARRRGAVAFVGESRRTTINPSDQIIRKMLTVIGGWYFPVWEFAEIARFAVAHELPIERMVTHRFSLDDAPTAFRMFDERQTAKAVFVSEDAS